MTQTTLWDELVSVALVGTERAAAPSFSCSEKLQAMIEQVKQRPAASKEVTVLSAAAIVELYRRAGTIARKCELPVSTEQCPQDEARECTMRAALLLTTLIEDRDTDMLSEWLRLAKKLGKRTPYTVLPKLLEMGTLEKSIRPLIAAIAGHRARWLAKQNSDWSYILQADVGDNIDHKTVWELGTTFERVGALRSLRRTDALSALELLTSTWSQEPSENRILFVAELETNLTMADEPFLEEHALDDKRKEVREKATQMLMQLPQSRLIERMIARVDPLIDLKRFPLYSDLQVASLPETCDKAMARDGISAKPVQPGMGEKADWLMQMISVIHPDHWCERFNLSAMKLTTIANNSKDWRRLFLEGWRIAAMRHRSRVWAEALIPLVAPNVQGLINCLTEQQREEFFLSSLKEAGGIIRGVPTAEQALTALMLADQQLSIHCSKILLDQFKKELTVNTLYSSPAYLMLPHLAVRLDPSLAEEALTGWRQEALEHATTRDRIDKFMATIQTRREIHEELAKP